MHYSKIEDRVYNDNDTITSVFGSVPINYEDDLGNLAPIDNKIADNDNAVYNYKVIASDIKVEFPKSENRSIIMFDKNVYKLELLYIF